MTMSIVLADDNDSFRAYLRTFLGPIPDLNLVGEAQDGLAAIRLSQELRPDFVLMDIRMPELNGIEATRQIVSSCPGVTVLGVSMFDEKPIVTAMIDAGASGYLLKEHIRNELSAAIQAVARGEVYIGEGISVS